LAKKAIHQQWIDLYYSPGFDVFYELAFDYILDQLRPQKNAKFLDAGCGNCYHAIQLAQKGFSVQAVDFSPAVLELAQENIKGRDLKGKIDIKQESLLDLSFDEATFDYILCWGVLMHIPEVEKAIRELSRVVKPGGVVIVNENNMFALQSMLARAFPFFSGGSHQVVITKTVAGVEHIPVKAPERVFTREANIDWLVERFQAYNLELIRRFAGEFTDVYIKVPSKTGKRLIHLFNNFWFRYIKRPQWAEGNILFFQKKKPVE